MSDQDDSPRAAKRPRRHKTLSDGNMNSIFIDDLPFPSTRVSVDVECKHPTTDPPVAPNEQWDENLSDYLNWPAEESQDVSCSSIPCLNYDNRHPGECDATLPGNPHRNGSLSLSSDVQNHTNSILYGTSKEEVEDGSTIICFGMIFRVTATYEHQALQNLPASFEVQLDPSSRFSSKQYPFIRGRMTEHGQTIADLLDEGTVILHSVCTVDSKSITKKGSRRAMRLPCTLDITVYGPIDLLGEIGDWFQDYEVYLQDPQVCHMDTRYCNPQKLSSSTRPWPLVSEIVSESLVLSQRELPQHPDFLDVLSSHIDLEEAPQPLAIQTPLKGHQKQALTFMLDREQGWGFNRGQPDIWEIRDAGTGGVFLNTVSRACQAEEPPAFYGGIIADPMGFGKTLTMIALVATDIEADKKADVCMEDLQSDKPDTTATLVIIPPPLLGTWEEELAEHVVDGGLVCRRHHGRSRITEISEFDTVSIVLTTYHTVSADWKTGRDGEISPLFSVRWKRVILDEAHFIRNGNAKMARAVCELESASRWAVTGTPIQNRLGDLASLLKFIRAHPYTDPKQFDADVSRPWKSGEDEEAVKRLKRLSACLLLRRPKGAIIDLPQRRDLQCVIDFTLEERTIYDQIRDQAIININEALSNDSGASNAHVYVNVLQQIESLRVFSNLGLHYFSRHRKPPPQSSELEEWKANAQRTFNSQREMASIICLQCSSTLGLTETLLDHSTETAQFTSCLRFVCSECANKASLSGQTVSCGHTPPCPVASVSTSGVALEEVESLVAPEDQPGSRALPSKIEALLEDIKRVPNDVKCVVFSTWRLTLDLIARGLDKEGIRNIRFDGKVLQKDRHSVVTAFNSDPTIRIMLLTLSCGAVGLTLTAASRAYLMEPHWNPTLEEQALARIHRLGQRREVDTVRFYVRDSFEEQVMKVQESKKQLAGVLLSPHESAQTSDNLGALEKLRSLL
ncbi:SNF2 family N-terminal domain-containing protein [Nemania abortiva]|nr:SNF2 family N-terminal domain-containing protein [Nemania abortiva]